MTLHRLRLALPLTLLFVVGCSGSVEDGATAPVDEERAPVASKKETTPMEATTLAADATQTPGLTPQAAQADLDCSTRVFNTAATATCSGSGVWRLRIDCQAQGDFVGEWMTQNGGTVTARGECRFKARGATVESR